MRNFNEILTEAQQTKDLKTLISCWNEISSNKYKFPLIHLKFAQEYIGELAIELEKENIYSDYEIKGFIKHMTD